eukprot:scaffold1684_cov214-Amphora_coffeaeformis.AAC.2
MASHTTVESRLTINDEEKSKITMAKDVETAFYMMAATICDHTMPATARASVAPKYSMTFYPLFYRTSCS